MIVHMVLRARSQCSCGSCHAGRMLHLEYMRAGSPRAPTAGTHTHAHADVCCRKVQCVLRWAEAHIKIARMTLTIKLDGNWSSFQLANSAPPLSVTDSAIAPSARMHCNTEFEIPKKQLDQ